MGIKQKFFLLAGVTGVIMTIISVIGYYTAYNNLEDSVEKEILATIETQKVDVDGWLRAKQQSALAAATLLTSLDGQDELIAKQEITRMAAHDKEILSITNGNEKGLFMSTKADNTGKINPQDRFWYKQAKQDKNAFFTDAYVSASYKKLVVSAIAPYFHADGSFAGALCENITLDTLEDRVQQIKYRGEGTGIIIEKTGKVLASSGVATQMSEAKEYSGIGENIDKILNEEKGYITFKQDGVEKVFAFSTVPANQWVIGVTVPADYIFSAVNSLRLTYGMLTLVGIALTVFSCLKFSGVICAAIIPLESHANELSKGNLRLEPLEVRSNDEIGSLTQAFNSMSENLHKIISKMASTSEAVAASSEELTANTQQSAEASVHVAETIGDVNINMEKQLSDVNIAKESVDAVFVDINSMSEKAKQVTRTSNQTAEAAKQGESLMKNSIEKMEHIDKNVSKVADTVKALGESSMQIGQIVDAISAISEQTNLLALNAAIEAARAGEHGRGFAVVAEEVRKLASGSQESAEQIKTRIHSIQAETKNAVEAMEIATKEVEAGTHAISEVGAQFGEIMNMVSGINKQMMDINNSVNTVSYGAKRIVNAMDAIDSISRDTAEHTHSISAAAEEQSASNEEVASASASLANLAAEMQDATSKFKF